MKDWISVDIERPPGLDEDKYESTSEYVLIYDKNHGVLVGNLTWDHNFIHTPYELVWSEKGTGCGCCNEDLEITHWALLPEPPKEKK